MGDAQLLPDALVASSHVAYCRDQPSASRFHSADEAEEGVDVDVRMEVEPHGHLPVAEYSSNQVLLHLVVRTQHLVKLLVLAGYFHHIHLVIHK